MYLIGAVVVIQKIVLHHGRCFQHAAFGIGLPVALQRGTPPFTPRHVAIVGPQKAGREATAQGDGHRYILAVEGREGRPVVLQLILRRNFAPVVGGPNANTYLAGVLRVGRSTKKRTPRLQGANEECAVENLKSSFKLTADCENEAQPASRWLAEFGVLDAGRQDVVQRHTGNDVPVGFIAWSPRWLAGVVETGESHRCGIGPCVIPLAEILRCDRSKLQLGASITYRLHRRGSR